MDLQKRGDDRFDFLNEWINKIVVVKATATQFPPWKQNRSQYLYTGHITDQNLREVLPNEVIIEFDDANHNPLPIVQQEAIHWSTQVGRELNKHKVNFKVTQHEQGKSPHIRFIIDGLEHCTIQQRKVYKTELVKDILQAVNFQSSIVVPDYSLLKSASKLVALEHQPHFKYGTTEEIIYTNDHPRMVVRQEKLRAISKETRNTSHRILATPVGLNLPRLAAAFSRHYREGRRHFIITGFASLMRLKGFSKQEAINTFYSLAQYIRPQENERDAIEIAIRYNEDINDLSAGSMFRMAYNDDDKARDAYIDFLKCFERQEVEDI